MQMTEDTFIHRTRMEYNKQELFTPTELAKLGEQYNLFTTIKNTTQFDTKAFDAYATNRATDFNIFKETKGPDGATTILKSLKDKKDENNTSKDLVKSAITNALIATPTFTDAQTKYNADIKAINTRISDGSKDTVSAIVNELTNCVSDAGKAILNQQQNEKVAFKNLFKDNAFIQDFKNVIGTNSDDEVEKVRKSMKEELKKSHLSQLEAFDKSTCDSLIKIHNADAAEKNRLYLLATLHKNDETMRDLIDKKIKANKKITNTQVSIGQGNDNKLKIDLSGVEFDNGENFSLTGNKTNFLGYGGVTKQAHNSYTVELDNYVSLNIFYYLGIKKNVPVDFLTLASAMRGQKDIVITLEVDDPKLALERGRQVYEAFVLMGHDPKDIKELNINGKVYKLSPDPKNDKEASINELFKGHGQAYAAIQQKAEENRKEFKSLGIASKSFDEAKTEIKALREKGMPKPTPNPIDESKATNQNKI